MPAKKLLPEQIAQAARFQARGWTHRQIAERLGVHKVTVARALARVNKKAYEQLVKNAAAERGRQLAVLEEMLAETLEAWDRSKKPTRKVTKKTGVEKAGNGEGGVESAPTEIKRERATAVGDPRYLAEARAALADRRKILGIESPQASDELDLSRATEEAEREALEYRPDAPPPAP